MKKKATSPAILKLALRRRKAVMTQILRYAQDDRDYVANDCVANLRDKTLGTQALQPETASTSALKRRLA